MTRFKWKVWANFISLERWRRSILRKTHTYMHALLIWLYTELIDAIHLKCMSKWWHFTSLRSESCFEQLATLVVTASDSTRSWTFVFQRFVLQRLVKPQDFSFTDMRDTRNSIHTSFTWYTRDPLPNIASLRHSPLEPSLVFVSNCHYGTVVRCEISKRKGEKAERKVAPHS